MAAASTKMSAGGAGVGRARHTEVGGGISREGWYCLLTVSIGYLLVSWGMGPVSSILPTISADLGIDVSAAGWIMNAYFLLLVGAVLVVGRLGDIVGHRYVFATGVAIFGLAAVAAGLAGSYEALVVARAVQGIGSAMVFGTSLALVSEAIPSNRRGLAIGILTTASGAGGDGGRLVQRLRRRAADLALGVLRHGADRGAGVPDGAAAAARQDQRQPPADRLARRDPAVRRPDRGDALAEPLPRGRGELPRGRLLPRHDASAGRSRSWPCSSGWRRGRRSRCCCSGCCAMRASPAASSRTASPT